MTTKVTLKTKMPEVRLPEPNGSVCPLSQSTVPRYSKNMENEFYNAAEHALANFLGTDDIDQDVIELVGDCAYQAVQVLPDWDYFGNLLEKASTYVRADMDELEMQDFVGELEEQLEVYGLL
jgi:hypothetical protein